MLLILLHGNGQVESVFSIYDAIIVANLHEKFIILQHQIYDGLVHPGRVGNVEITEPMVKNVYIFHSHYKDVLKRKKRRKLKGRKKKAQKRLATCKIKDMKAKKPKLSLNHKQDVCKIQS